MMEGAIDTEMEGAGRITSRSDGLTRYAQMTPRPTNEASL